VLTLISIVAAAYFYVRGRRVKRPCWAIRTSILVEEYESRIPGLEIAYKGQRMKSLEVTRAVFWNAGRETIRGTDLDSFSPLRVVAGDGVEILDVAPVADNMADDSKDIVQEGSLAPQHVEVTSSAMGWLIKFRYLEPGRGAVLQIVHTSPDSAAAVSVVGSIIGAQKLEHRGRWMRMRHRPPYLNPRAFAIMWIAASATMTAGLLASTTILLAITRCGAIACTPSAGGASSVIPLAETLAAVVAGLVFIFFLERMTSVRIPSGLEVVYETI
jgi:hypothetical protein